MKHRGFTLVELLVVIAVIGLISSVAIVATNSSRNQARYARIIADMAQIGKAAELYYQTSASGYPADLSPGVMPSEFAPYLAKWPTPPCSGWLYDWQNWSSNNIIEVTIYNGSVHRFYYCINANTGYSCSGTSDITTYTPKSITCNE